MLNEKKKELLAVIRYYNSQKKDVAKLVKELVDSFDLNIVESMTGYSAKEIKELVNSVPARKPRRKNYEPDGIVTDVSGHSFIMDHKYENEKAASKPEPLFDTSTIVGRVANEAAEEIDKAYHAGEAFLSKHKFMKQFNVTDATAKKALAMLLEKGILVRNEKPNSPYVVK